MKRLVFLLALSFCCFFNLSVAVAESESSIAGPNSENGLGTSGAPNAGIITMSIEDKDKSLKTPRLGIDLFSEIDAYPQALKDRADVAGLAQFFAHIRYAVNQTVSVYVRPQWMTTYDASTGALGVRPAHAFTQVGDTIFGVIDTELVKWRESGTLTAIARYYAPTGELSRNIGQKGLFYGRFIATQPLNGRVTLLGQLIGDYWLQGNDVSLNSKGKYVGNLHAEMTPYASMVVKVVRHLDFTQSLGLDYIWLHGSQRSDVQAQGQTKAYIDTSFVTDVVPHLTISIGANNEPLLNGGDRFQAFRDSEAYFYTMIYATM